MTKQELLKMVEALPEGGPPDGYDRIAAEVQFFNRRTRLLESIDEIDRGGGIPHEEIEAMMDQWLEE